LRVGFELTGLELDWGGYAQAASRLHDELERRPEIEVVPLAQPRSARAKPVNRLRRGLRRELLYLPLELPRRARRLGLDLLHCATPLPPPPQLLRGLPLVLTLFDALPWCHPEWLTRANAFQQRLVVAQAARRAACVVTASSYSRASLVRRLRLDPERVAIAPLGVGERFKPGPVPDDLFARLGVPGAYILTVGTLQPRKNLTAALAAFERLVAQGTEHTLVIAGGRGWRDNALIERIESSPARERVHLVGRVGNDELVGLYRGAACFVFPSRFEGFGLPPLEAMACGTPVITSNRTSLPEVVGDAGILVDPDDHEGWAQALARVLSDDAVRADLAARGRERAARFSWARCADETLVAYRRALS
jgi:glycosyltransferase involved in cell wall biosynthesis